MSLNVANKKVIRHISFQSMKSSKTRNIIAVLAITLTTVLFTALFTIAMSLSYSFEQSNFRQAGGYAHGSFKDLTKEQANLLKDDDLILRYGIRFAIGMLSEEPFNKSHVEVSYCDENTADFYFLHPVEGRLPKEGTKEAATDTRVLSLLGVKPEIGTEFTLTIDIDGTPVTETFTLCGYWEYDEVITASHVLLPEDLCRELLNKSARTNRTSWIGAYVLNVMFRNANHIEENMETVLSHYGYQSKDPSEADTYINTGVNWGYVSAQLNSNADPLTVIAIAAILLLIIATGYLIIYNVFQISVSNDIRFYGLLKTIGTTGKQIRRIVLHQALLLSAIGIPIGLLIGYGIGALLLPIILSTLDGVPTDSLSVNPLIFIIAALFALTTIIISCRKPGKMAAKVTPIEAVRYTERTVDNPKQGRKPGRRQPHTRQQRGSRQNRRAYKGASLLRMALANLGRNRRKTIITVLSLSLAVVLLNLTFTFTNGFDMNKYVSHSFVTDFVLADANYMNVGTGGWSAEALPEEVIDTVSRAGDIKAGGRTYGQTSNIAEFITEQELRALYSSYPNTIVDSIVNSCEVVDGLLQREAKLYGMDPFCLDQLTLLEGDLSKLYEDGNYIAAVYVLDDYGHVEPESHWAKVGDTVKLRYLEDWEYYNPETGAVYDNPDPSLGNVRMRTLNYDDKEYEVAALVAVPHALSYRLYGAHSFVLNSNTFKKDTGTDTIMYYAFNMADEENTAKHENNTAAMENFLADFTTSVMPQYDYESRAYYAKDFESFRNMFLIMGGALSFIIGLVGILNFINAILTSIFTRHREFAVLQAVGMTGRQLRIMLAAEGLLLTLGSVVFSFLFILAAGPLCAKALSSMFWFFTYRFTILPVFIVAPFFAVLGALIPLVTYKYSARKSIVERLREAE
ncbi:MAG: ABC transporter permease [Lachnospiraceae bacterium]|nr:ABC transporter permease [Lachnospiraceae bacterium]